MRFDILFCGCNGFLDGQSVEREINMGRHSGSWRIGYDSFFGIETFFTYIATFHQRNDRQVEMFGKGIVTAVMCRYGHDGSCPVAGQHVIAYPNGDVFARERVDGIRTREHAGYAAVGDTFAFRTFFGGIEISFHFCLLGFGRNFRYPFAFGSQYHERDAEHGVGPCGKDREFLIAVFYFELHFRAFRAPYPVALRFFQ